VDAGTIPGFLSGYVAAIAGVLLMYLPVIVLFVAVLIAGGIIQLLC
jgi:hypothetical protein